nr:helix-turn-helix domain-containing protein [Shouchella xiaoxiensis]
MLILKQRYPHELKNALFYYEAGALRYIQPYEEKAYLIGDHPAIVILEEYDLLNQTSLLETVMVYVKNNGHVSSTAKALHIHLNSLQYRLKRITDLTGLQLKDPTERIGIYLDLHRRQ